MRGEGSGGLSWGTVGARCWGGGEWPRSYAGEGTTGAGWFHARVGRGRAGEGTGCGRSGCTLNRVVIDFAYWKEGHKKSFFMGMKPTMVV